MESPALLSLLHAYRGANRGENKLRFRRYVVTNFTVTGGGNLFRVNALILLKPVYVCTEFSRWPCAEREIPNAEHIDERLS